MNALVLARPEAASVDAASSAIPRGPRLFQLEGDACEPALRGGDYLMVVDVDRFRYDAPYLLDLGDGEAPFVVTRGAGRFSIRHPNPRYSRHELTPEQFAAAVRAIVVAEIKMKDAALLRAVTG